uniref:Uncharacterized protein n=1 Tax=Arundo donax TaxID=35708 RepID=A0A0A9GRU6_ARUDO
MPFIYYVEVVLLRRYNCMITQRIVVDNGFGNALYIYFCCFKEIKKYECTSPIGCLSLLC